MTLGGDCSHAYDGSWLLMKGPQQIRTNGSVYGRYTLERLLSSVDHFLAPRSKRKTGSRRTSCGTQASRVYIRGRIPNKSSRASCTPSTYSRTGRFGSPSLVTLLPRFRSPCTTPVRELLPLVAPLSPRTLGKRSAELALRLPLHMLKYLSTTLTLTPDFSTMLVPSPLRMRPRGENKSLGRSNLCDALARYVHAMCTPESRQVFCGCAK